MSLNADDIYKLLPAIYRTRDAANGEPLKSILGIVAEQAQLLADNMQDFYADQFIETCAPWAVPYIGDLVGWQGLFENVPGTGGGRAEVANTIGYRRRKGTLIGIEQIAQDVTGRPACVVEFFKRLATTQYMNHLRPDHEGFVDLRQGLRLERIGGAFDDFNRTADLRRIAPRGRKIQTPDIAPLDMLLHGAGRFNIPDIGAYVWRWKSYPVTDQPAFRVDERRYLFSPLGNDVPLFNAVKTRAAFSSPTARMDVPQPIARREFHDNLALALSGAAVESFYGDSVSIEADGVVLTAHDIRICNLENATPSSWPPGKAGKVALDPVLGRILFPPDRAAPSQVLVSYCYGFGADIGGGSYSRIDDVEVDTETHLLAVVGGGKTDMFGMPYTLADAIADYNAMPAGSNALVVLADFNTYAADVTGADALKLAPGGKLWIVSAHVSADGSWSPESARATVTGDIEIVGLSAAASSGNPPPAGELILSGVLMAGAIRASGEPVNIALSDTTLVPGLGLTRDGMPKSPGSPSLVLDSAGSTLSLTRCITGPLFVHAAASASIASSVVDATNRFAVSYAGPDGAGEGGALAVKNSTLIGKARTHLLELGSNTIFLGARGLRDPWDAALWCTRLQKGCLRYSVVPADAIVPARFQCLPSGDASEQETLPRFVSLEYGRPSYGMLAGDCPIAVWQGADDESEIGAFHDLFMPQAMNNLATRFGEYLPFALEAGIFLVPSHHAPLAVPRHAYGYGMRLEGGDLDERDLLSLAVGASLI
jgi:hypothetical protein